MKKYLLKLFFSFTFILGLNNSYAQKIDFPLPYIPFEEKWDSTAQNNLQKNIIVYKRTNIPIHEVIIKGNGDTTIWAYVYENRMICKILLVDNFFIYDKENAVIVKTYLDEEYYAKADQIFSKITGTPLAASLVPRSYWEDINSNTLGLFVQLNYFGFHLLSCVVNKQYEVLEKYITSFKSTLRYGGYFGLQIVADGYILSANIQKQIELLKQENPIVSIRDDCFGSRQSPLNELHDSYTVGYYKTMNRQELLDMLKQEEKLYQE